MRIEKLKERILKSNYIVFFGGAGVSTESNIPDFRSKDGIYNTISRYGRPPEEILSHGFFMSNPKGFYDFYKNNMIYAEAKPNKAHRALAELEQRGMLKAVITQNIDGLHQMAGTREVLELHGSVYRNYCMKCGEKYGLDYILQCPEPVPVCTHCGDVVKPDVVLYEESLDMGILSRAAAHVEKADMLIVGGTSLAVYPAAGLLHHYKGDSLVLINKSTTQFDNRANLVIHESIGEVLDGVIIEI